MYGPYSEKWLNLREIKLCRKSLAGLGSRCCRKRFYPLQLLRLPFVFVPQLSLLPLPDCKDAVLLGAVKDFVAGFYAGNADKNAAFRRRRHFITHNLAEFSRENIANYKTEAARPVSDIIIDLKVNKNILEENMLLCKNQSPYKDPGNVYILVYPEEDGYRVHLINLGAQGEDVSFFYKKA